MVVTFILAKGLVRRHTGKGASGTVHGLVKVRPGMTHMLHGKIRRRVLVSRLRMKSLMIIHPKRRVPISNRLSRNSSCISRDVVDNRPVPIRGGGNSGMLTKAVGRHNSFVVDTARINDRAILTHVVRVIRRTRKDGTPIRHVISHVAKVFIPIILKVTVLAFVL